MVRQCLLYFPNWKLSLQLESSQGLALQRIKRFLITLSLWLEGWARPPFPVDLTAVAVDLTALFAQERRTCFMEIRSIKASHVPT